jgi:hypothetical protein
VDFVPLTPDLLGRSVGPKQSGCVPLNRLQDDWYGEGFGPLVAADPVVQDTPVIWRVPVP